MSRDRFEAILQVLRFVDHATVDTNNRLYKIKSIIETILDNTKKTINPERELSLDKSMIQWRGKLRFKQYIQNKRHKYGIKLYELTTKDGFILNVIVYTGRRTLLSEDSTHTEQVVKQLMEEYLCRQGLLVVYGLFLQ